MQKPPDPSKVTSTWQPRFGMHGMLLLMLVVSVMAAGGYYLAQSLHRRPNVSTDVYSFHFGGPLLVMVAVSILNMIFQGKRRR